MNKRFEVVYREGSIFSKCGKKTIMVDTQTGVEYLVLYDGMTHTVTPLLGKDGQPVIMDNKA